MLTYDLTKTDGPLYKCLYECIKNDISQGKLSSGEKMPSKRTLAKNLGVSTITVENAYDQLIGEGYMFARPKRGYFIADVSDIRVIKAPVQKELSIKLPPEQDESIFDFSSNRTDSGNFPFSIWAKLMRETISLREQELLSVSPCGGVRELREAIASHLSSFRGMNVDPDQIIVGAGTEYLYGLLVKLLGKDKVYCVEDPGYKKISQIYECNNAKCLPVQMDEQGISVELIKKANAQIAHISPTHHFPTGITMPVNRRYELLAWANESSDRYIIEDDYDSEFRMNGHPIPPILSIDACEKVIYINTFSKSLTSTIRISYMVLPGGADRSYGIQVAKLAGLPDSVIERAKEIAEQLLANDITDTVKSISVDNGHKHKKEHLDEVDMTQISLFDTVKDDDIIDELRSIDIGNMTPLDALNKLYQLQNKVKNRW